MQQGIQKSVKRNKTITHPFFPSMLGAWEIAMLVAFTVYFTCWLLDNFDFSARLRRVRGRAWRKRRG